MNKADEFCLRTTVYVRQNRHSRLKYFAGKHGQRISDLIIFLAGKMAQRLLMNNTFRSCAVQYQKPASDWITMHVSLTSIEYDRLFDIKKCFRISVSLLIAMAIDEFLDREFDSSDSYPPSAYYKSTITVNNNRILIFCWGIPAKNIKINIPLHEGYS